MRTPVAGWLALLIVFGLFALVWTTSRVPCVPYGLWYILQMQCR